MDMTSVKISEYKILCENKCLFVLALVGCSKLYY